MKLIDTVHGRPYVIYMNEKPTKCVLFAKRKGYGKCHCFAFLPDEDSYLNDEDKFDFYSSHFCRKEELHLSVCSFTKKLKTVRLWDEYFNGKDTQIRIEHLSKRSKVYKEIKKRMLDQLNKDFILHYNEPSKAIPSCSDGKTCLEYGSFIR